MVIEAMGLAETLPMLLETAVRGAAVLLAAGAVTLGLRKSSAAVRHLVWTVALTGVLAMPVIQAVVPEVGVLPVGDRGDGRGDVVPLATFDRMGQGEWTGSASESLKTGESTAAGMSESAKSGEWYVVPESVPESESSVASESSVRASTLSLVPVTAIRPLLLAIWLLVACAILVPVLAGWLGIRRLERRSRPIAAPRIQHLATRLALRIGLRREFRLLGGPPRAMPMTWGIARPVILLPSDAERWPAARLEAVLLHELAHVKRRDCLTQLLAEVVRAAHWFNPLVWVAARQLRIERERASDDVALTGGAGASRYATELLGLAREYRASRATTLAAVAMARPSQLSDRLLAVLDEGRRRGGVGRGASLRVATIALLAVLPLAALAPAASASPDEPDASEALTTSSASAIPMIPVAPVLSQGRSPIAAQEPTCAASPDGWEQVQHQSNDDRVTIQMERPGCELEVRLEGEVALDAAAATIARMGPDARVRIEEDDGRMERYLEVRPGARGVPSYVYRVNGREAEFGGAAQAWYRAVLLHLFRTTSFAAEERVQAILDRGGVEAVLTELGQIESSHVFATYVRELLERAQLEEAELRALVRSSARRVDSDHYMGEILEAVAMHQPLEGGILDDFIVAAMTLDSDHYRSQTLRTVVRAGGLTNEQVAGVLRAAADMDSDHYKTELLTEVADRYALEPGFRHAYLTATAEMDSDHYRSEVLERLLSRNDLSAAEMADVIAAAAMLDSDHYRSEILQEVARGGLGDSALQRAFFDAAAGLDSDHAYGETMKLLIEQDAVPPALLTTIVDHAASELDSDHSLSELLLLIIARHPVEGALRTAFLRAMDSIDSDHSRGRVADALLRSGAGA